MLWFELGLLFITSVVHLGSKPELSCGGSQGDGKLEWGEDNWSTQNQPQFGIGKPVIGSRGIRCVPPASSQRGLRYDSTLR